MNSKIIPMTLLTGFLGSGKSTLINRMVKDLSHVRFGLVVNEFGDVKLESQIVEAQDGEVVELSNGCMCCVVRTDLVQSVQGFLDQSPNLDYLLVEASGLSDPLPIAQTFISDDLGGRIRFDSIITVVDALNFSRNMSDFQVALNQLKYADFVIITKDELTSTKAVDELKVLIKALAPKAMIFSHQEKNLFSLILDTKNIDHEEILNFKILQEQSVVKTPASPVRTGDKGKIKPSHKVKHDKVDTFFYKQDQPMDFTKIGKVLDSLPENVVRAKGVLYLNTPESSQLKVIFQSVALRNSLDAKPWKLGEDKFSAMVFIGKNLDKEGLKKRLDEAAVPV